MYLSWVHGDKQEANGDRYLMAQFKATLEWKGREKRRKRDKERDLHSDYEQVVHFKDTQDSGVQKKQK